MCRDKYTFVGLGQTATRHLVFTCELFSRFALLPLLVITFFTLPYVRRAPVYFLIAPGKTESLSKAAFYISSFFLLLSLYFIRCCPTGGFLHIRSIVCIFVFIGLGYSIWVSDTTF